MSQEVDFAIFISLAAGFALGTVYVLLRTRRSCDESDIQLQPLKQAANEMIKTGNLTGLNPHKVYKFCLLYEQMAAEIKSLRTHVRDMDAEVNFILANCRHEPSPENYAEVTYHVPRYMLLDIQDRKK